MNKSTGGSYFLPWRLGGEDRGEGRLSWLVGARSNDQA